MAMMTATMPCRKHVSCGCDRAGGRVEVGTHVDNGFANGGDGVHHCHNAVADGSEQALELCAVSVRASRPTNWRRAYA